MLLTLPQICTSSNIKNTYVHFYLALFITEKYWKQPKNPNIRETLWFVEYHSIVQKKKDL